MASLPRALAATNYKPRTPHLVYKFTHIIICITELSALKFFLETKYFLVNNLK